MAVLFYRTLETQYLRCAHPLFLYNRVFKSHTEELYMNNGQKAQLIFGKDGIATQAIVRQLLEAEGVNVEIQNMPYSEIGEPGSFLSRFMFYADETHVVVLSHVDAHIERPDDGGSTDEFCGFQWLIAKRGEEGFKMEHYINDSFHAFGKERAPAYFRSALIDSGKDEAGAYAVLKAFEDLCEQHKVEWQALGGEVEVA
jgi:hypothetical protein